MKAGRDNVVQIGYKRESVHFITYAIEHKVKVNTRKAVTFEYLKHIGSRRGARQTEDWCMLGVSCDQGARKH
jgi:hypothetical protein